MSIVDSLKAAPYGTTVPTGGSTIPLYISLSISGGRYFLEYLIRARAQFAMAFTVSVCLHSFQVSSDELDDDV